MIDRRTFFRKGSLLSLLAAALWQFWGRRPISGHVSATSTALSDAQFRTLVAACVASLDDEGAGLRAATEIDRFMQGEGREQLADLSMALRLLEFAPGGLWDGVRFSRLNKGERQRILEAWMASDQGLWRQIATGLHRAARFAHWSRAETWADLGYDGPWVGRGGAP